MTEARDAVAVPESEATSRPSYVITTTTLLIHATLPHRALAILSYLLAAAMLLTAPVTRRRCWSSPAGWRWWE